MSPSRDKVFVIIGCGPGIGVATAGIFAAHSFDKIALIARNTQGLENCRATVKCWDVDITQSAALNAVLIEVERMGQISCVLFNAARVGTSEFFDFTEEDLINDFQPIPSEFSLSMVKTSQRNMVQSLQKTYNDVHIAQLYVAGNVSPEDKIRSPELVAMKFRDLYMQEKGSWSREMEI
ncbi:hypothetical protein N431DRAFT_505132 [Stipitochalara longipes BDJ]|nr:hypothetical protein N431DRAFT_505132 [Stipitochalara longipes BDJ]